MPESLGSITKSAFRNEVEAHKLHYEFVVATGNTVHKREQVKLTADGEIVPLADGDDALLAIGVAVMDGAAGERVTVGMRAYCIIYAEAGADTTVPGPAEYNGWNATTGLPEYVVASGADNAAKTIKTVGHILLPGDDGDPIPVALL